jgi:hypothetical protein
MAIWGRRCRSAGCHEARRNNRGYAYSLLVGIATGRAGMDHVCRGPHLVLGQGRTIRVRRNGPRRPKEHRVVRGATPVRHQLHAGRGAGLFQPHGAPSRSTRVTISTSPLRRKSSAVCSSVRPPVVMSLRFSVLITRQGAGQVRIAKFASRRHRPPQREIACARTGTFNRALDITAR